MQKWEYYLVEFQNADLNVELNKLGQQGWECIVAISGQFLFKRPLNG